MLADLQVVRNFADDVALGGPLQQLLVGVPQAQRVLRFGDEIGRVAGHPVEMRLHRARDLRRHRRFAVEHLLDRADQRRLRTADREVADRALAQRVDEPHVFGRHRQHQHARSRIACLVAQLIQQRPQVAVGQQQVGDDDVGRDARQNLARLRKRGRAADDVQPRLGGDGVAQMVGDSGIAQKQQDGAHSTTAHDKQGMSRFFQPARRRAPPRVGV